MTDANNSKRQDGFEEAIFPTDDASWIFCIAFSPLWDQTYVRRLGFLKCHDHKRQIILKLCLQVMFGITMLTAVMNCVSLQTTPKAFRDIFQCNKNII